MKKFSDYIKENEEVVNEGAEMWMKQMWKKYSSQIEKMFKEVMKENDSDFETVKSALLGILKDIK
jgi:uncharacterized protein YneF (UPF0154 family)